jgi:hypothetical protein
MSRPAPKKNVKSSGKEKIVFPESTRDVIVRLASINSITLCLVQITIFFTHLYFLEADMNGSLINIFKYLNFSDFNAVERVSTEWRAILLDKDQLWADLLAHNVSDIS